MTSDNAHDIMGSLLSDDVEDEIPEVEQLNCLIFSDLNASMDAKLDDDDNDGESDWTTENETLSVKVWERQDRVRIKVSPKPNSKISIKHLGEVALEAIMKELEAESK